MSLYQNASLAMIPSAVKDGKLYSIRPTDGSGDFTFSRGSNLAATRVDVNGLIEKGRENLFLQSNQFDTTWSPIGASVTSGQSGYDGSSDAWLLNKSLAGGFIQQSISSSGVQTYSIYAKAGSLNYMRLRVSGSLSALVYFDFTDGSIHNNDGFDATMVSVGGGWYRCSYSFVSTITAVQIYPADSINSVSGASGSIYIQDAQLEVGLVATDYIETTTTTAVSGITEDLPRLDYSGGASCPTLLLEPQRQNLLVYSEYMGGQASTIYRNDIISPEGVTNALRLEEDTATTTHCVFRSAAIPTNASAVTYTISIFAKKKERDKFNFGYYADGISHNSPGFDLTNGTYTGGSEGSIEDYGNGWYRCSYTVDITQSTGGYNYVRAAMIHNNTTYYAGDGSSSMYFYGWQLEQGSYPSSYIPTYGSAVTRSGDSAFVLNLDTNNIVTDTQWSFLAEFDVDGNAPSTDKIRLTNVFASPRTYLFNDAVGFAGGWGGSFLAGQNRVKVLWRLNTLRSADVFSEGEKKVSVSGQSSDFVVDRLLLNGNQGAFKLYNITIFPTALTDSECIALTTL